MALTSDEDELVIRPRFGAGPLTLTPIDDVRGHVAHLDIDDAGVYLTRDQARELAAALLRSCDVAPEQR